MFIGRDFPPFENQAARVLGFDLAGLLQNGEVVAAVTSRLRVVGDPARDPTPADHLPIAPQFSGSVVNQLVSFNDPADRLLGNTYALSINASTTVDGAAYRLLTPWARFSLIEGYGVTTYAGGTPPAGTTSLILPAPHLEYTVPTLLGGYAGIDFPLANQSEALYYGLDFSPALTAGETISSATSYLGVWSGTDSAVANDPHAYDSGAIVIEGPIVRRKLAWPGGSALTGNNYILQLTALTSQGQSISAKARVVIGRVG